MLRNLGGMSDIKVESHQPLTPSHIFLHFHNYEVLNAYGLVGRSTQDLLGVTSLITRYALALSDGYLIILPKYLWETSYFRKYLSQVSPLITAGLVAYASWGPEFESDLGEKQRQYRDQQELFPKYFDPRLSERQLRLLNRLLWAQRVGPSSTEQITKEWLAELVDDGELSQLSRRWSTVTDISQSAARRMLENVPLQLDGRAFVLTEVERSLPQEINSELRTALNFFINRIYVHSYLKSLPALIMVDTPLGQLDFGLRERGDVANQLIEHRKAGKILSRLGLRDVVEGFRLGDLVELRADPGFSWIMEQVRLESIRAFAGSSTFAMMLGRPGILQLLGEARSQLQTVRDVQEHVARIIGMVEREVGGRSLSIGAHSVRPSRKWLVERRSGRSKEAGGGRGNGLTIEGEMPQERLALRRRVPLRIGVMTVKREEFDAVRRRFPRTRDSVRISRLYHFAEFVTESECPVEIYIVNVGEPGGISADSCAQDLIRDVKPALIFLVGIGGGMPSKDYTLGDVVLARGVQDLRVHEMNPVGDVKFGAIGYRMPRVISDLLNHFSAFEEEMRDWSSEERVGSQRPVVTPGLVRTYGTEEWAMEVRTSLNYHFAEDRGRRHPISFVGPIASSDTLVKNAEMAGEVKTFVRSVAAFEMEAAGVLNAAERVTGAVPILIVKGISDIIGLRRDEVWTAYACETAASLVDALVHSVWLPRTFADA